MKLARTFTLVGLGLVTAGYLGVTACSSSSGTTGGTGASVGGAPKKPSAPATTSTTEHTYAINNLLLGDTDRTGNPSTTACPCASR